MASRKTTGGQTGMLFVQVIVMLIKELGGVTEFTKNPIPFDKGGSGFVTS